MPIEMVTGEYVAPPPIGPLWGAWSVRHSVARKMHDCHECGHLILSGDTYWRRFGRMGESLKPWVSRFCERCEATWRARSGAHVG